VIYHLGAIFDVVFVAELCHWWASESTTSRKRRSQRWQSSSEARQWHSSNYPRAAVSCSYRRAVLNEQLFCV